MRGKSLARRPISCHSPTLAVRRTWRRQPRGPKGDSAAWAGTKRRCREATAFVALRAMFVMLSPMRRAILIVAALFTSGCATMDYFVADGNRAAGTVTLVCEQDIFTVCLTEPSAEHRRAAAQACMRWGYDAAQPFGRVKRIQPEPPDHKFRHEMVFQCVGDLK